MYLLNSKSSHARGPQPCNFTFYFWSVRNLVSRLTGGTECEDVEKQLFRGKFATTGRDDIETENK